ncbi:MULTISPECIES: hypothetical protein [Salibacterium]|uniref:Uncharacterized protein n=2 Tax=Salibacterium TaxID=1884429 RepID=A0A1I4QIX1_9BACI|nr:hypothetical protein [Salibacterium qingdaonense]SFM39716.1 hypothetical protein SAMN04488054_1436 [Salibacterium qingdaonense]
MSIVWHSIQMMIVVLVITSVTGVVLFAFMKERIRNDLRYAAGWTIVTVLVFIVSLLFGLQSLPFSSS